MKTLTVFEHRELRMVKGSGYDPSLHLTERELEALERFHALEPRYFSLVRNGVRFNQWVGLLRAGDLQIEVLPKLAGGSEERDHESWRRLLLDMLVRSGLLKFSVLPKSLTGTRDTLLDIILAHYMQELEQALHRGLIKRYRRTEGNLSALKGKLLFAQQMRHNLVHQERFYMAHTRYDFDHALNQLLAEALDLIPRLTQSHHLRNRAIQLSLELPPISEVANPASLFDKIRQDRKSAPFAGLVTLARLIVERHHPSLSSGEQETFSLMFDMNRVFEEWLRVELNAIPGVVARKRHLPFFNYPDGGSLRGEPDLVVVHEGMAFILDAKWKLLSGYRDIGVNDLRQIYAYLNLHQGAIMGGLLYPAPVDQELQPLPAGAYEHRQAELRFGCRLGQVPLVERRGDGRIRIQKCHLMDWFEGYIK